jgi:DNA polymerase-3 subunit delta
VQFAQQRSKKLLPQAARILVEFVGPDLARLESEVEKLCLYVGQANEISPQDVEATSVASAGPGEWDLMNAIRDGRTAEALDLLERTLTRRGLEFKLMGGLIWQYRQQLSGKPAPSFGGGDRFSRPTTSAPAASKRLPRLSPRQALRLLLQTDLALKSGADTQLTMQTLVLRLCGGK